MDLIIVLHNETCFESLNGQFVCSEGVFLPYCGPTQMVTNDQSSSNLVFDSE